MLTANSELEPQAEVVDKRNTRQIHPASGERACPAEWSSPLSPAGLSRAVQFACRGRQIPVARIFNTAQVNAAYLNIRKYSSDCACTSSASGCQQRHLASGAVQSMARVHRYACGRLLDWRFSTVDARHKLQHIYPSVSTG